MSPRGWIQGLAAVLACGALCARAQAGTGAIAAVGIENEYADVIAQVGGAYVQVRAIEDDPNTDPHSFEASPSIARAIAGARLVVKNGLGYDGWADRILAAAPNPQRRVIDVQHLRQLPDSTPNPHLWYDPATMPAVAAQLATELAALQPAHAAYFHANAQRFDASLAPWRQAIAAFRRAHPGTPFAVTEPVGDYLLQALGGRVETPFSLEAAVMNGTDPAPQDISAQTVLLDRRAVSVFVYNQQVTDALTKTFLDAAKRNGIPVVGVYETMPTPGFSYQSWMLAETQALSRALTEHASTQQLLAKPR